MDYKKTVSTIIPWIIIIASTYGMTLLNVPLFVINIFFVVTTSICLYYIWRHNAKSNMEIILILLGLILRVVVCLIDVYGREFVTIPFSGSDSEGFYLTSVAYYNGDMSGVYTKYPYIINAIYQIVGLNRFAVQYVNILCWSFCALLMQKSCTLLKIEKLLRIVAVGLLAILPFHVCISSILMRDLIVTLSIMLTTYCMLKWMKDGKYLNVLIGVVATVPVLLVHNCVLAMLAVMGIMVAFYSPEKGEFCLEKKAIVIFLLGLVFVMSVILVPPLKSFVLSQIPTADGGFLAAINGRLGYFYRNSGGSTYLLNVYVNNYWELFVGTFQRMAYFLLSPVPWMWRGLSDIAGFLASTSIVIVSGLLMIVSVFLKKRDVYRTLLFMVVFFISGIFAWAVSNGGTALRHREKLLGVMILLGVYSVQLIKNGRANK